MEQDGQDPVRVVPNPENGNPAPRITRLRGADALCRWRSCYHKELVVVARLLLPVDEAASEKRSPDAEIEYRDTD